MKMDIIAFISLAVISFLQYTASEFIEPEEGWDKCIKQFSEKLNETIRKERIQKWKSWDLEPGSGQDYTMCFTKCLLEQFQLFDNQTNRFNPEQIEAQYKGLKQPAEVDQNQISALKQAFQNISREEYKDCDAVYETYYDIHSNADSLATLKKLFHSGNVAVL